MTVEIRNVPILLMIDGGLMYLRMAIEVDENGDEWLNPDQVDTVEKLRTSLKRSQISGWSRPPQAFCITSDLSAGGQATYLPKVIQTAPEPLSDRKFGTRTLAVTT